MNSTSIHPGSVLRAILLCAVLALLGTTIAFEGDAAPATGTIKSRTQSQREHCEIGGGQLQVVSQYKTNGAFKILVQSTTTCKGGATDGYTCVNTKNSTTCTQAAVKPTEPAWYDQPITVQQPFANPQDIGSIDIVASPVPEFGG